jgi:predicted nucleotidyltransferase
MTHDARRRAPTHGPLGSSDVSHALHDVAARYAKILETVLEANLVSVVLYGSVARREATATSDIDLFVVCEHLPEGRFARLESLQPIERQLGSVLTGLRAGGIDTRLAVIARTRSEAARTVPLYLDMVEDAQILYDRDGFFAGVLARLRTRLRELGAERRRRGRVRYWVLKPDYVPGEVITL